VLNALCGLNIQGADLALQMNKPVWRGMRYVVRRIPNWATFPWGMVDIFRSQGLNARWQFFTPTRHLFEGLYSNRRVLMPVLGSWKPMWAHVMTLVAWDRHLGWGFANTQFEHHNISWVPDNIFQKQWRATGRLLVEII
jgi:hypothetical protein